MSINFPTVSLKNQEFLKLRHYPIVLDFRYPRGTWEMSIKMNPPEKMEKIGFDAAKAKLEGTLKRHVLTLRKFYTLFDKSMTHYGEENSVGLNLVGIYDRDLTNFTGLAHLGLLMPRARFKIRYSKEKNRLDLEVSVLLDEYGRGDNRDDPFDRMRMEVMFDPESQIPFFEIRRFESEEHPWTGRETIRPVDQGLDLLLASIADRLGAPRGRITKKGIQRRRPTAPEEEASEE